MHRRKRAGQPSQVTVILRPVLLSIVLAVTPGVALGHSTVADRIQLRLEEVVAKSPRELGAGLLAISTLGQDPADPSAVSTFVSGRRAGRGSSPVSADTPYGIASITKTFVATLTLIYAERGLLNLDAPALDMLGDKRVILDQVESRSFRRNLEAATARDLLAHRSGLPDYWEDRSFLKAWKAQEDKYWDHWEILAWAGKKGAVCKGGQCFNYADTNFLILGLLLEKAFGAELHKLMRQEIFAPLGMRCTWMYFEEPAPAGCGQVAHSYEGRLDVTANRMQSADWSGGGIYSTMQDQLRFLNGLFGGNGLLSAQSLKELQDWRSSDLGRHTTYGLGIYKKSKHPGMTLIGHTGIHNAFTFLWQETGLLFTGSLNQEDNHVSDGLLYPVMKLLTQEGAHRLSH
jgi:D-alanyl-D-alanine carboxypeptidase